ncbi:MAG: PorV/PorQ family protein [Salinibacter sp.]
MHSSLAEFLSARPVRLESRLAVLALGLMLGLAPGTAFGQNTAAGAFTRLGFGARGMALGNALVAAPSADVSPHYNPALLPAASGQRVSVSAALLSFDRELQFLEFTAPLGPTAGVGLNLIHAGVNGIDGRNADGVHTETLSTDEFALSLSFGNQFADWLAVGTSLTLYHSNLLPEVDPARGFGLDFGVRVRMTDRLQLAGAVSDLLAKYEWDASSVGGGSHTDRFPVRVRLGASYTLLGDRLRLLAELESRYTVRERRVPDVLVTSGGPRRRTRTESFLLHDLQGRVGVSYQIIDVLHLRAGLDRIGVRGVNGLRPSAGFGIRQSVGNLDLRVSYAATLEPYVRTVMSTGTVEVFL